MDLLSDPNLLDVLLALLPGFLTAQIIDTLVVREDRSPFERIVQALIFTFLSHLLWALTKWNFGIQNGYDLVGLGGCAIVWGLGLTWLINSSAIHDFLRWCRLTQSASRPSEWYDSFYDRQEHVILHLKDGRRIFGWPRIYSFRPDKGHILLEGAEWLDRPKDKDPIPRRDVDFLIDVTDVRFVEFIPLRGKENSDA